MRILKFIMFVLIVIGVRFVWLWSTTSIDAPLWVVIGLTSTAVVATIYFLYPSLKSEEKPIWKSGDDEQS